MCDHCTLCLYHTAFMPCWRYLLYLWLFQQTLLFEARVTPCIFTHLMICSIAQYTWWLSIVVNYFYCNFTYYWGFFCFCLCVCVCVCVCVLTLFIPSLTGVFVLQSTGLSSLSSLMLCYAKSLQSCPTLCDPIDGSPVPGILQARTLEWVAISFSNAWKWKVKVKLLSRVWLPHGLQPTRLLRPWDFPGKSTRVGCHAFSNHHLS